MIARYPGQCASTGRPIAPGDRIIFDTKTRRAYLDEPPDDAPGAALARDIDPTLDPEEAAAVGLYMTQAARRYQSHTWRAGGREYYRNKAGLCIDAPCCGCCNA
jgi:hypothetical protein